MFSSLPPLHPHDPSTLWYPSLSTNPPPPPSDHHPTHPHANQPTSQHFQQANLHRPHPQRTLLSILRADENAILHRKSNIRRFGSGWLRPPGVGKTLQGMADERAEREEVEGARAREMALAEAQAEAEAEAGMVEVEGLVDGDGDLQGRDLDEEVPDADADAEANGEWSDADMTEDEDAGELDPTSGEGVTLLEDEGEEDLDAEVPEGEYEHTDTEVEDSSSEEEDVGVVRVVGDHVGGGAGRGPVMGTFRTGPQFVGRANGMGVGSGGGLLGSSVFGSSSPARPVERGGRRSSGRGRGGREN